MSNNREQDEKYDHGVTKHSSDDDEGDEDLLNAVARWADQKESKKDTTRPIQQNRKTSGERDSSSSRRNPPLSSPSPYDAPYNPNASELEVTTTGRRQKSLFSLHITNLPYSSTKEAIIKVFEEKGCRISSTRLVYNHHSTRRDRERNKKNQGNNDFTGVAFVDMVDKGSYRKGLGMDKMQWLEPCTLSDKKGTSSRDSRGRHRKINVRPTRTKEELAVIVQKTEERLALERDSIKEERNDRKNSKKRMQEKKDTTERDIGCRPGFKAKKQRQTFNEPLSSENKKSTKSLERDDDVSALSASDRNNGNVKIEHLSKKKELQVIRDKHLSKEANKSREDHQCDEHTEKTPPIMGQVVEKNVMDIDFKSKARNRSKKIKLPFETKRKQADDDLSRAEGISVKVKTKRKKKLSKKERAKKAAILNSGFGVVS